MFNVLQFYTNYFCVKQMDMTKTPEQLMEDRVQSAFAITIWQGAYRSRSLTISNGRSLLVATKQLKYNRLK